MLGGSCSGRDKMCTAMARRAPSRQGDRVYPRGFQNGGQEKQEHCFRIRRIGRIGATSVSLISKTLLNCSDIVTLTCDLSQKSRYRCSTKVTQDDCEILSVRTFLYQLKLKLHFYEWMKLRASSIGRLKSRATTISTISMWWNHDEIWWISWSITKINFLPAGHTWLKTLWKFMKISRLRSYFTSQ